MRQGPAGGVTFLLCVLFATVLSAATIAASDGGGTDAQEPIQVCVSIPPQAYLAERVGGDMVDVSVLVPPGSSPHTFEPTPSLVARFAGTRVFFLLGLPFEDQVVRDLRSTGTNTEFIGSGAGIELLGEKDESVVAAHHDVDPHVWLSPTNARIIASNMRDGLVRIDPDHSDLYDSNFEGLSARLDSLDQEIRTMLRPYRGESFFVFHPAYAYFAEAYGLHQVAIEREGREPGPRDLAGLISEAKAQGATVIFVQPQNPAAIAKTAANEIGAKVVVLDPLEYDYPAMLRHIAREIAAALSGPGAREETAHKE